MSNSRTFALIFSLLGLLSLCQADTAGFNARNFGVTLFTEPKWQGENVSMGWNELGNEECYDFGHNWIQYPITSIRMRGWPCCVLFRTYCPPKGDNLGQLGSIPFIMNQRIFRDIEDLDRYGWGDGRVRSIICLSQNECGALRQDNHLTEDHRRGLHPLWVDYRDLEYGYAQEEIRKRGRNWDPEAEYEENWQ